MDLERTFNIMFNSNILQYFRERILPEILSGIIVLITMWLNYKLFDELTDALGERSNRNE